MDNNKEKAENINLNNNIILPQATGIENDSTQLKLIDYNSETPIILQNILNSFGIEISVETVIIGPTIITYHLKIMPGVSIKKIRNLEQDISLGLGLKVINIKQIPNKPLLGIEVERNDKELVKFGSIVNEAEFNQSKSELPIALGKDMYGKNIIVDLKNLPHLLISGTTGSGKSICIHSIINSILLKTTPDLVKFLLIDPKAVELTKYAGIPHLLLPTITDVNNAFESLSMITKEMEKRYNQLTLKGVKDFTEYNNRAKTDDDFEEMPYIIIVVDEFAELIEYNKALTESLLYALTQRADKVGIHLIIATERPSTNVITGSIKVNFSARIALKVFSQVDSKTILDISCAEKLFGNGDLYFKAIGFLEPIRIQGTYISEDQINTIVTFFKSRNIPYNDGIEKINIQNNEYSLNKTDPLLIDAIDAVIKIGQASPSFIQRLFKVGYARAGRIIDQMESMGIISGYAGNKPRQVLISKEKWQEQKQLK